MNQLIRDNVPGIVLGICCIFLVCASLWVVWESLTLKEGLANAALNSSASDQGRTILNFELIELLHGFLLHMSILIAAFSAIAVLLFWNYVRTTLRLNRALAIQRQSHDRYRFMAEGPPSLGMVRFSIADKTFTDANRAALNMVGAPRSEFVSRPVTDFVLDEDRPVMQRGLEKLMAGARSLELTVRMPGPHDIVRDVEWHISRIGAPGRPEAISILTDATEKKRAQAERLEKERLQGVLEMAGAAAHELNQPMQIILGYVTLLSQRISEQDPSYKLVEKIQSEAEKMGEIGQKIAAISEYKVKKYVGDTCIIDIEEASKAVNKRRRKETGS